MLKRANLLLESVSELVLKAGNVLYAAENQHREHFARIHYTSIHAEMNALFKYLKIKHKTNRFMRKNKIDCSDLTVYVVRLKEKTVGNSKPCEHCQKWLKFYNVKRIFYTDVINDIEVLCEMRLI